jgi:riboflavin kinase/FMN adenylyltransferase
LDLISGLHNLQPRHRGCAATIGNFDGVHLGHQQLFADVRAQAAEHNARSCVVTFEPLPVEYFAAADKRPRRLMSLREKYRAIKHCGIDQLLILPFNHTLAQTEAPDFIRRVLVNGLEVKHLTIGDDFHFGRNRAGDFAMLQHTGRDHSFDVAQANTFTHDQQRVSSTRVRTLLQDGNLAETTILLGRHYALQGRVVYGRQLGRTLDFPTANIHLKGHQPPLRGVYVVEVEMLEQPASGATTFAPRQFAIANIGNKPTVDGSQITLEAHLLDFPLSDRPADDNGNLYGARLRLSFLSRLRDEKKFASLDELKQAINNDATAARKWLSEQGQMQQGLSDHATR